MKKKLNRKDLVIKIYIRKGISGIYQIKNVVNGKKYIGKSKNITLRWYYHNWFLDNYDYKKYIGKINVFSRAFCLEIQDKDQKLTFVFYVIRDGKVIVGQDDTRIYLERFKEKCQYDKDKHYIVGDFKE